jgi:hypothetical protein
LSEIAGPLYGTTQSAKRTTISRAKPVGESLGDRIIVTGRVIDEYVMVWSDHFSTWRAAAPRRRS